MQKQNTIAEIQVSYHPENGHKPTIKSSQDAFNHIKEFFSPDTIALQEQFVVAYINRANRIIGVYVLSKGVLQVRWLTQGSYFQWLSRLQLLGLSWLITIPQGI